MNRLSDARQRLYVALQPTLPVGRVSIVPPAQLVAPCVYIETSAGGLQTQGNATVLVATFPIVCVVDGDTVPSSMGLDDLIAEVFDRARAVGSPSNWSARSVDAGGPNLRGATISVDVPIVARTLCDPPITDP